MNNVKATIGKLVASNAIVSRKVEFRSTVKPAAKFKATNLEKRVLGRFIIGQEYQADGSDSGSDDPRSLPWGEWASNPDVIRQNDPGYVRFTPAKEVSGIRKDDGSVVWSGSEQEFTDAFPGGLDDDNREIYQVEKTEKARVLFSVNGDEVTREEFAEYLTPANARKLFESSKPDCITVKIDNLVAIR